MRVKNQGVIGNSKTSNLRLLNLKQQKQLTTDPRLLSLSVNNARIWRHRDFQ